MISQVLVRLDRTGGTSRKCLHVLRKICGSRKVLPANYELSKELLPPNQLPNTFGGFCDAYEGTLSVKVCIKRLRVSDTCDLERIKEVSHSLNSLLGHHSLTNFEAILQRGPGVETPESPKHCAFQGSHVRSASAYLGVDAWWRVAGPCQEQPEHKPRYSCRSIFSKFCAMPHPFPQTLGIAQGLVYLHSSGVIHGDLKGVRVITDSGTPDLRRQPQSNILVDSSGNARITDFGLSTIARDPSSFVSTFENQSQTLRWTAPEILESDQAATKESDVFSFGMVMIEVCGDRSIA